MISASGVALRGISTLDQRLTQQAPQVVSQLNGDIFEDPQSFYIHYQPDSGKYDATVSKDDLMGRIMQHLIHNPLKEMELNSIYEIFPDNSPIDVLTSLFGINDLFRDSKTHELQITGADEDLTFRLQPRSASFDISNLIQIFGDVYSDKDYYYFGVNSRGYRSKLDKDSAIGRIFMEMKNYVGSALMIGQLRDLAYPNWSEITPLSRFMLKLEELKNIVNASSTHMLSQVWISYRPHSQLIGYLLRERKVSDRTHL